MIKAHGAELTPKRLYGTATGMLPRLPALFAAQVFHGWEAVMADPKPLWEVMHEAYWRAAGCDTSDLPPPVPDCYAAEIRALADEVAPESEVPSDHEISTYGLHIAWVRWAAMHSIRAKLLNAAAEAEGDAEHLPDVNEEGDVEHLPDVNEEFFRRHALENLRHASMSFRLGVYSNEELVMAEDRAEFYLKRWPEHHPSTQEKNDD
jgi:hypothetical protein